MPHPTVTTAKMKAKKHPHERKKKGNISREQASVSQWGIRTRRPTIGEAGEKEGRCRGEI